jgi:hypothetical protein
MPIAYSDRKVSKDFKVLIDDAEISKRRPVRLASALESRVSAWKKIDTAEKRWPRKLGFRKSTTQKPARNPG